MLQGKNKTRIYLLIIAFLIPFTGCSHKLIKPITIKFNVILNKPLINQKIYLTGNNDKLGNWNPAGIPLDKESETVWNKTVIFNAEKHIEFKLTKGTLNSEAINSDGWVFENFTLDVSKDTTINIHIPQWKDDNHSRRISRHYFGESIGGLNLINNWKFHTGDNEEWANENVNDSLWETVVSDLTTLPKTGWKNNGWFRTHFEVDSSLWNRTLAIRIEQFGASEIYYNGKLIYSFGRVGSSTVDYQPNSMTWWQELKIDPKYEQLIAVKYANYDWKSLEEMGFFPGFLITLKDLNTAFRSAVDLRENSELQMFFTLIPLILALVHLSLYGFLRIQRQNLYYAICMLGFAGLTYFSYERNLVVEIDRIILLSKLGNISVCVAILFGALTGYEINYQNIPKRILLFVGMFISISVLIIFGYPHSLILILNYIYFGLLIMEVIYSFFNSRTTNHHGARLIKIGTLILCVFILFQLLTDYSIIPQTQFTSHFYAYGMMSLAISMSIFLSYNFSRVNNDLEIQLKNVKHLSDKAIEHERLALASELERKSIELESERKSRELESARQLQLSMLPKDTPQIDNLDIACRMKTASEVGGDYYDFFFNKKNNLTVVIGDATGHGLKAGNMVIVTKGILNILSSNENADEILIAANRAIKRMNLHMLTMCLAILRISKDKLQYSSAGMPPLLLFRRLNNKVDQIILKAMPLGAFYDFPYQKIETRVSAGDVILMMSDGLMELFNAEKEVYGIERVAESLIESQDKSADEIAEYLVRKSETWSNGTPLSDDMTMVVIKIKSLILV